MRALWDKPQGGIMDKVNKEFWIDLGAFVAAIFIFGILVLVALYLLASIIVGIMYFMGAI